MKNWILAHFGVVVLLLALAIGLSFVGAFLVDDWRKRRRQARRVADGVYRSKARPEVAVAPVSMPKPKPLTVEAAEAAEAPGEATTLVDPGAHRATQLSQGNVFPARPAQPRVVRRIPTGRAPVAQPPARHRADDEFDRNTGGHHGRRHL